MAQEMEDSVISLIKRVRDEAEDDSDLDSSPNAHEGASRATMVPEKAKRSINFIVSLTGSLTGPRDFVYYGTDLDAHTPALATNSIRLCGNSDDLPPGKDVLTYPGNHQQIASVSGLHASIIEDRSPLLAAAFESSNSGQRLHLETLCSHTVMPFVRFLYTGSYSVSGEWEDVPTSVFLHCKMYHLGNLYDLFDLKSQAYVNLLRQCEFGCSSPEKPIDLCEAIGFAYKTLPGHNAISDAIVQYCVSRCLSHKLHEDAEFRDLAFNVNAFHKDLTRVCRERGYEDESSAIIIQLPYKHHAPDTYASTEDRRIIGFTDMVHHFHSSDKFDDLESPKKKRQVTLEAKRASPMNIPGCFDQTMNASPFTTRVEARPSFNNVALPIRQPTTSQTSRRPIIVREQLSYEGTPLPYRGPRDDLEKLSTAPPGLGFFGQHESAVGHENEHPFDTSHVGDAERSPKRVVDEMERILRDFESGKARQYITAWRDCPSQGVPDVTGSRSSQASMEGAGKSGSEENSYVAEVKRRRVERQTQKDYDSRTSWRRSRFTRLPSNRQPRAELPHAHPSGSDGAQASCMSVADSEDRGLPTVPRFTLSNDTLDLTVTQLSDATPRTVRPDAKGFEAAGKNISAPLPVMLDHQSESHDAMRQRWQDVQDQAHGSTLARSHQPTDTQQTRIHGSESTVKEARPSFDLDDALTAASQQRHKTILDWDWLGCSGHEKRMTTFEEEVEKLRAQSKIRPMVAATSNHDTKTAGSVSGGQAHADLYQWRAQHHQMQLMLLGQQKQEQTRDMTFDWNPNNRMTMSEAERQKGADRHRAWSQPLMLPGQKPESLFDQTACCYGERADSDDPEEKSSAVPDGPSTAPAQTGELPSSAQQTEPEVSAAATESDIDMCESDSGSDLSWVDVPLADPKAAQPAASGTMSNPSSGSGSTDARRLSTRSDSEWDFC